MRKAAARKQKTQGDCRGETQQQGNKKHKVIAVEKQQQENKKHKVIAEEKKNNSKETKLKVIAVEQKTAERFVNGIPKFMEFIKLAKLEYKLSDAVAQEGEPKDVSNPLYDKSIIITGFRNKGLSDELKAIGAKESSAVSKNTFAVVVKNKDDTTGKLDVVGWVEWRWLTTVGNGCCSVMLFELGLDYFWVLVGSGVFNWEKVDWVVGHSNM